VIELMFCIWCRVLSVSRVNEDTILMCLIVVLFSRYEQDTIVYR
jgi:hypothetical protein